MLSPRPPLLAPLLLALAACGTLPDAVEAGPDWYPGFPRRAQVDGIYAEATFRDDHARALGADLTSEGVLPIWLRVGSLPGATPGAVLSEDVIDAHLYLQDGTVLEHVAPERVAGRGARATDAAIAGALELSRVRPWDAAESGALYFAFAEEGVRVRSGFALSASTGVWRELDLLDSLLGFTVTTADGPRHLFVGVKAGRGSR
jgi:hypothetical protein